MPKIIFTKMAASGNDFVLIEGNKLRVANYKSLAKNICDRKFGAGADGLLVLEKSKKADLRMRIFNADGSEAEMCGNGARCAALYKTQGARHKTQVNIETKAGIIEAQVKAGNVKIKLTDPKGMRLSIPLKINNRILHAGFIDTGVPQAVVFTQGLDNIDVENLGRQIRFHREFSPRGTNVNFVEFSGGDSIRIRTYERGVEGETLACGTGSAASALLTTYCLRLASNNINVLTRSGETLRVYFKRCGDRFQDVWLEGRVGIVYKGVYNV